MRFAATQKGLAAAVLAASLLGCFARLAPSPAQAHDLAGVVRVLGSTSGVPEAVKSFYRLYIAEGNQQTRSVLVNALMWPIPSRLTVCFDGGPPELRPKIAAAMREWDALSGGNLVFVFSDTAAGQAAAPTEFKGCDGVTRYSVRIGFVRGDGHWSQIGTLSNAVFPQNSMNLDFDKTPRPDDTIVRGITLHETGHALGFHHEHQSKNAPCAGFAWDRILVEYNWPGTTLEDRKSAMHFNLDRLSDEVLSNGQHAYTFTAYDRASIMHYSFPPTMFTDASNVCSVPERHELSALDKEAMKDAYLGQRVAEERTRGIDELLANPKFQSIRSLLSERR